MRKYWFLAVTMAIGCARSSAPPPDTAEPGAAASAASAQPGQPGWKRVEAAQGFSLEYPEAIFTTVPHDGGVALTSRLVVNEPHGAEEKSAATEHRFSARFTLRDEDVVSTVKRVNAALAEAAFPGGDAASFMESPDFASRTRIAGRDTYVLLSGAHGYARRHYFVAVDAQRTLSAEFDVITDYLAPAMPKDAALSEAEQIAIAEAVVRSLTL